jgi:hypothetical protein
MAASIKKVRQAFTDLYASSFDRVFRKTIRLDQGNEKEHLPYVRFFLLGFFGALEPERKTYYPGCKTGWGKFDFMIDKTAVEFAVRKKNQGKGAALGRVNKSEIIKLMKYNNRSILVIFDYSKSPLTKYDLNAYRTLPSLGKGNHHKFPLNVLYLYRENGLVQSHFLNIQAVK